MDLESVGGSKSVGEAIRNLKTRRGKGERSSGENDRVFRFFVTASPTARQSYQQRPVSAGIYYRRAPEAGIRQLASFLAVFRFMLAIVRHIMP